MRKGFGFHDRHSPFRFDPATLFIGGAIKGAFYDSSNITTLFQDDAGTTPVTTVEQTVGRILDLSGNSNHATQSVALSRPTYRARYNLLTFTEQFDNAAWATNRVSVTQNAAVAPDGTTTADLIQLIAGTGTKFILQAFSAASYQRTYSFYVKYVDHQYVQLLNNGTVQGFANFDILNGIAGTTGSGVTSTIVPDRNGYWRCTITHQLTAATQFRVYAVDSNSAGWDSSTSSTGSFLLWGAQILPANDVAATGNAYQRVAAATSYDTSSPVWRPYLALDGSDDSLLTSAIDFTGTNEMTVWAGLTKSSDAAQGVVAELSATIASNNGAFLLSAPNSAAANYNWSSKGTTQVDNTVTTYTAPNTAVLTGQANIAAPSNIIRVNGAQAGSVATTQGTGNFGNYPLFIGRRNNATLPFNGRLYGLIVLGAAASDWQVYVTEQWMAGKTGLQF